MRFTPYEVKNTLLRAALPALSFEICCYWGQPIYFSQRDFSDSLLNVESWVGFAGILFLYVLAYIGAYACVPSCDNIGWEPDRGSSFPDWFDNSKEPNHK